MHTRSLLILTLSLGLFLAGCTSPTDDGGDDTDAGKGTVLAKGGGSNNVFEAKDVTVATGTTVTWLGHSGDHTVTFETPIDDGSEKPDSGNLGVGDEYELTFEKPGTYRYRCIYHSSGFGPGEGMVGTVTVS